MGRKVELECNCGCGEFTTTPKTSNWFVLSQLRSKSTPSSDTPKIKENIYFASLACLLKWSNLAAKVGQQLQEDAGSAQTPRGRMTDNRVPELYA